MCDDFYKLRDIEIDIDYIDKTETQRERMFSDQTLSDTDLSTWKWDASATKM